jgi:hypothetical protein
VVVHWSGYTSGYQGKRVDNTSVRDDPFVFTLGRNEVIPAFEEAVLGMRVGGLRRVDIPGAHPELSYPRKRSERFTDKLNTKSVSHCISLTVLRTATQKLRIVTHRHGGDRNRSLNDGQIPNPNGLRAHASTGYSLGEGKRRASRNGRETAA